MRSASMHSLLLCCYSAACWNRPISSHVVGRSYSAIQFQIDGTRLGSREYLTTQKELFPLQGGVSSILGLMVTQ